DVGLRIFPIEARRRPAPRFGIKGWIGEPLARRTPAQMQQGIAGYRLIASRGEKVLKLLAGDLVFSERKRPHADVMLRAFVVEPSGLIGGAAHGESARR